MALPYKNTQDPKLVQRNVEYLDQRQSRILTAGPAGDITTASTTPVAMTGGPSLKVSTSGDYIGYLTLQMIAVGAAPGYQVAEVYNGSVATGVSVLFVQGGGAGAAIILSAFGSLPKLLAGSVLTVKVSNANAGSSRYVNATIMLQSR